VSTKQTPFRLFYKQTAYNWLAFSPEPPPAFDENGQPTEQTKLGTAYFTTQEGRDLAFLLLNGRLMFAYWAIVGDDFDVTRWMFEELPINPLAISQKRKGDLLPLVPSLERAMNRSLQFKLNAGKRVGSYNMARPEVRAITDRSDRVFADHSGLTNVMNDVALLYRQTVKTEFAHETASPQISEKSIGL
jgi:hypothetical protein